MNKSELVTHDQAVILKELGFDKPCFYHYVDGSIVESCYCGDEVLVCDLLICENEKNFFHIQDAPTLYQVRDWILEKTGIFIDVSFDNITFEGYFGYWTNTGKDGFLSDFNTNEEFFETYYEAFSNIISEFLNKYRETFRELTDK